MPPLRREPRTATFLFLFALAVGALALLPLAAAEVTTAQRPLVLQIDIDGPITRATVEHLTEVVAEAERTGAHAILVRLDTPGGGVAETDEIVKMMLRSPVPFIGFVAPVRASALSAGTMILMATDVAVMAPGTTIGSVQPVLITPGGFEPVTDEKIINALVAQMEESLAAHERNETLARAFIEDNLNLNAEQALAAGAIEFVAEDTAALLQALDGYVTVYKGAELETANAEVVLQEPSLRLRAIIVISNPLLASILFLLGIYGIIFGISAPGHGAEIFGVIAISLGLIGLGFAVNLIALFLIILGIALVLVEVATPSFGALGAGGIIALALGSIFLAPVRPPEVLLTPEAQTQIIVALLVPTAAVGGFLLFALYKVLEARRAEPFHAMVGQEAVVIDPLGPGKAGFVRFEGELWRAEATSELKPEEKVFILEKEGPLLRVGREPPTPPEEEGRPESPVLRVASYLRRLRGP